MTSKIYTNGEECTLIFSGKPVTWKRPGRSGGRIYDKQYALKEELREEVRKGLATAEQGEKYPLGRGVPLKLSALFIFPSSDKKVEFHGKRPDLDNLIKFYLDMLQGVMYEDDCSIYSINCRKIYILRELLPAKQGMTEIRLRERGVILTD